MGEMKPLGRRRGAGSSSEAAAGSRDAEKSAMARALARAGLGDEEAFGELYDATVSLVFGVVLKVVKDPTHAEEVAQEVFTEIWRLAPRYEASRGSASSWVAMIAHRRAVDRVRSEQSHRDRNDVVGRQVERAHDSVSELVIDRLDRTRVLAALERLTDDQREALELAYFGGHTYRQVAVLLDTPEGTIKARIRDALIKLRDHLGVNQ